MHMETKRWILKDPGVLRERGCPRYLVEGLEITRDEGFERGLKLSQHVKLIDIGEISTQRRRLIVYLSTIGVLALMTLFIALYLKPPNFKA